MSYPENINKLLDKYYKKECNSQEKQIVERFFLKLQENGISASEVKKDLHLKNKIYRNIEQSITPRKRWWIQTSAAAVIIVLISSVVLTQFFRSSDNSVEYLIAKADYGEQLKVILSDSSVVYLNSGSSIEYPKTFNNIEKRNVKLQGEGFFEVTKDKEKPFIVSSGNIITKVLGTKFVISNFKTNTPSVIVSEGKVNVSKNSDSNISVDILSNEKVVFNSDKNEFTKSIVNSDNYDAWIYGDVVFNDSNLSDIAEKLSRRFNLDVKTNSEENSNCLITGRYTGDDLPELLGSIQFINGLEYKYNGTVLELKGVDCNSN
ncbi:FecR family protein [Aquimarina sp. M1]